MVVSWIANHSVLKSSNIPFMKDILAWISGLLYFHVYHICHEANQPADYMATKALQGELISLLLWYVILSFLIFYRLMKMGSLS